MSTAATIQPERLPSVLVSFAYRQSWAKAKHVAWREVVLDSGAFTVHRSGGKVDLLEFAEWAKEQRATNPLVTEIFTLDVIGGDWRDSLRNTEELHKLGLPVIPVYHVGEPVDVLKALARDYPKIALGGAVGYHKKLEWAALCFREVWPKKIHGLGFGYKGIFQLPFHSIDHTALTEVFRSARYHSMGHLPIYTSRHKFGVNVEIQHLLDEEARARRFWSGRLPAELGDVPAVRLAASSASNIHTDALENFVGQRPAHYNAPPSRPTRHRADQRPNRRPHRAQAVRRRRQRFGWRSAA